MTRHIQAAPTIHSVKVSVCVHVWSVIVLIVTIVTIALMCSL